MAKETKTETRTSIDDLNDSLVGIEQKVQENKKGIMWVCIGVAAVVCLVLVYFYAIRQPGIAAANDAIGLGDVSVIAGDASIALAGSKQVE